MDKSLREILSKIDKVDEFTIEYANAGKQRDTHYSPSLQVGAGSGGYIEYEAERGLIIVKQNGKKFITAFNLDITYSQDSERTKHLIWKGGDESVLKGFVDAVRSSKAECEDYPYSPEDDWIDHFDVDKELAEGREMRVYSADGDGFSGSGPETEDMPYEKFIKDASKGVMVRTTENGYWSRSYTRRIGARGAKKSEIERMASIFKGLEPAFTKGHELSVEEFKRYTAASMDLTAYKAEVNVRKAKHEKSEFEKFAKRVYDSMKEVEKEKSQVLLKERKAERKREREAKAAEFAKKVEKLASVLMPSLSKMIEKRDAEAERKRREEEEWARRAAAFNESRMGKKPSSNKSN